jgi:hypothetical protein
MKYPLTCLEGNNNLAFVSVPLRPFASDTALGTGTGFFFQPVFGRTFLVTNRHIVIEESDCFFPDHLVLKMHTDAFHLEKSEDLIVPLYSANGKRKPAWLELDSAIDVIALELDPTDLGFPDPRDPRLALHSRCAQGITPAHARRASVRRNVILAPARAMMATSTVPRSTHVRAVASSRTVTAVVSGGTFNAVFGSPAAPFA